MCKLNGESIRISLSGDASWRWLHLRLRLLLTKFAIYIYYSPSYSIKICSITEN
jgi:hypothetical protein